MKICLISNLYKPYSRGGAEQIVQDTIKGLKDGNEDVFLITTKPFKNLSSLRPEIAEENGIKIYRFYPLNLFHYFNIDKHNAFSRLVWHMFDVFNIHSYFVVKNILKKEKPDIVHTHNLKGIGYLIPRAIKSSKIRHIHTLHDIQFASPSGLMIKNKEQNWQQNSIGVKIYSIICRYLFGPTDIVISPSQWLKNYYTDKKFFKKTKQVVLRNPIEQKGIFLDDQSKNRVGDSAKFLFIGQVEEHKGVLFLIDVFNSLKDLKINLDVIGGGKILECAKKISTNSNINFYGKLPHKEALEKIQQTDFIIVPSLCYENSPVVVIEAINFGKPVIAANIGGTAELINEKNGYKFEAGNKEELVDRIKLAIKNIDNFNSNGIKQTIDNLNLKNYIEKLINIYGSI